jgi:hypothetical protein
MLKDYAIEEWLEYYQPSPDDPPRKRISAVLDCFCESQYDERGVVGGFDNYESKAKTGKQAKVCREWIGDKFIVTITNTVISIVINILNFILRYLIKFFVRMIRETTLSGQMKSI